MTIKVGITGSIGSGKSTVTRIFSVLGVPVYDADSRAKELMVSEPLVSGIKNIFGEEAYSGNELNRQHIAALAFKDKELLAKLNAVVHPVVISDFDDWVLKQSGHPYVVKEAALMFESDSYKALDNIIVVTAPEALRVKRTMQRSGATEDEVRKRMQNQMSEDEKLARADYEIKNDEVEMLIPQVLRFHEMFRISGQG